MAYKQFRTTRNLKQKIAEVIAIVFYFLTACLPIYVSGYFELVWQKSIRCTYFTDYLVFKKGNEVLATCMCFNKITKYIYDSF